MEDVQYCEECSVLWKMFSTMEDVQYCGECSVIWRDSINTVVDVQYCRGILYHKKCEGNT